MIDYVAPEFEKSAFNCPFCEAYTQQDWQELRDDISGYLSDIYKSTCVKCEKDSIWYDKQMIFPLSSLAPLPHKDMPEAIKTDYLEARNILQKSPRGACALLRLVVQKLCDELVEDNQNLFNKIGILVERGLPKQLQQAFDLVRITGNDAVHGLGAIDPKDNPEIAQALFKLVNMIVEKMITEPKEVNELYNLIPENKLVAIEERDN